MTHRHAPENDPVAVWLRRVAASEDPPASLPSAGQLLWKAEILRRLEDEDVRVRRAARPAEWSRRLVGALAFAAVLSLVSVVLGHGASGLAVPETWILIGAVIVPPLLAAAGVVALVWRDA